MGVNVSKQSPQSDYANFGAVVSANWNAANERALKMKIHEDSLDQRSHEFDETMAFNEGMAIGEVDGIDTIEGRKQHMIEKEYEYRQEADREMRRISEHKYDIVSDKEKLIKDYKATPEGGYGYDPKFFREPLTYLGWLGGYQPTTESPEDKYTREEWMERENIPEPDYSSYEPEVVTPETLEYLREQQPSEKSVGGSDVGLMNSVDLLQLLRPSGQQFINPYSTGGK